MIINHLGNSWEIEISVFLAEHKLEMRRATLFFFSLLVFSGINSLYAQQEPMYTKYMFNSMATNPGYAGSFEFMSVRTLHRQQWIGIEGGPLTQTFTIHTPYKDRVGLGLSVANDQIGATGTTLVNGVYAYKIPFGKGNLAIGLQAGVMNWRADFSRLKYKDPVERDQVFSDLNFSRWFPNFGAGIYYSTNKFYLGFSVPRLMGFDLRPSDEITSGEWARTYRHYYFNAGGVIPIKGNQIIFKPSLLIKSVGLLGDYAASIESPRKVGAPLEFDIDLSLLFYEAFWIGTSFRSAFAADLFGGTSSTDSADLWAAYYLTNGFRIGISYDFTLSKLKDFTKGTYEVMLGYDFVYNTKKVITPRYF